MEDITWIVQITYKDNRNVYRKINIAGFCIHASGLFMSCAHPFFISTRREIKIRMLKKKDFYNVAVVHEQKSWNIVILKIASKSTDKTGDYKFGKFASNGSLAEGEFLVHMGHSMEGSYYIGRVSYPCVETVTLPVTNQAKCRVHKPTGYQNIVSYKTMGHIYNTDFLKNIKPSERQSHHAGELHPSVPIVEFNGFTPARESLGGPVFNTKGEIVGMVAGDGGESFAIHVTALRYIFGVYASGAKVCILPVQFAPFLVLLNPMIYVFIVVQVERPSL